jgi:anti-anti-sigma regulatory factor
LLNKERKMGIVSIVKDDCICLIDSGNTVLCITETIKNNVVEIALEGDLRSDTALTLGDELKTLVLLNRHLSLNLQKVNGLSTSCCQAFLSIQQTIDNNEKGSMKLVKIPVAILEKMSATGLTALLQIENSKEK